MDGLTMSAALAALANPPLTTLGDPYRAERYQFTRALLAQYLLRRLILQIRYGCTNFDCDTPSCFSRHVRVTSRSIPRRPSFATARLMAYAIIMSGNPRRFLCNSPINSAHSDLVRSDDEMDAFISHWLGDPLKRGINYSPFSPFGDPASFSERWDLTFTPTLPKDLIPGRQIILPVPVGCRNSVQQYLINSMMAKVDLDSLSQMVAHSPAALLFEMFGPDAHVGSLENIAPSYSPEPDHPGTWNPSPYGTPQAHVSLFLRAHNLVHSNWPLAPILDTHSLYRLGVAMNQLIYRVTVPQQQPSQFSSSPVYSWFGKHSSRLYPIIRVKGLAPINEVLFSSFSSPLYLTKCFRNEEKKSSSLCIPSWPYATSLVVTFRMWKDVHGHWLLDSLSNALQPLQIPPPKLREMLQRDPDKAEELRTSFLGHYVPDQDAGFIIYIVLCAIISYFPLPNHGAEDNVAEMLRSPAPHPERSIWSNPLPYGPALRLAHRLLRVISVRRRFDEMMDEVQQRDGVNLSHCLDLSVPIPKLYATCRAWKYVLEMLRESAIPYDELSRLPVRAIFENDPGKLLVLAVTTLLQTIIGDRWIPSMSVDRWSVEGSALDLLLECYVNRSTLKILNNVTAVRSVSRSVDPLEAAQDFLTWTFNVNRRHICEYIPVFTQSMQQSIFRAIHSALMFQGFITPQLQVNQLMILSSALNKRPIFGQLQPPVKGTMCRDPGLIPLRRALGTALSPYLVISCRRSNMFMDSVNSLWGRSPKEYIRPLKIFIGTVYGELGDDQGGVSQEFFSLVLAEVFDEKNGFFVVTDESSGAVYFRPDSSKDLTLFVMIGLLVGLALHNGCTIPVNFPHVLYMKLGGMEPDRVEYLSDAWPTLSNSLSKIAQWDEEKEGSTVAEAFCRTFTFTVPGKTGDTEVEMAKFDEEGRMWDGSVLPNSDLDKVPEVTGENRSRFVNDYVHWLANKSVERQFYAFSRGFYATLNDNYRLMKAVDPCLLKSMLEGSTISIHDVQQAVGYIAPFSPKHQTIKYFWEVVSTYDSDKLCKLLEFITSSSRVPAVGLSRFKIYIRPTGSGTDPTRLPTASSCVFTLHLPEYPTKETLQQKLEIALEYTRGFGVP